MGGQPQDPRAAKADAKAAKARAKALRPWYKKKRFIIPSALVGIIVIGAIAGGSGTKNRAPGNRETATAPTHAPSVMYPDQQPKDHVAGTDGKVELFDQTVTASNLHRVSPRYSKPGICADVSLVNHASKSQDYNEFDFKLQTPSGDVRSFDVVFGQENGLGSGQLVPGGAKSGTVCFQDNGEKGRFILIWKPNPFDASRGIWLFSLG
jgi:hypothetical protein